MLEVTEQTSATRISVIVPCYNIAEYIGACLESLASQTHPSFEVICVDDGSTDATGHILDDFAAKDGRFVVIRQERQGPSGARNTGVAYSRAPFVCFVDGDDIVSSQYLAVLDALANAYDADIACCSFQGVAEGSVPAFPEGEDVVERALDRSKAFDAPTALQAIARDEIALACWAKMTRRELAQRHPLPEGKIYEDLWGVGAVVSEARCVALTSEPLYKYTSREGSITRARPTPMRSFQNYREGMMQFEEVYAKRLGLAHATDDASYCLHLVHRLCGQYGVLQRMECDERQKHELTVLLLEELDASRKLALNRGVPSTHPQMLRAWLLLRSPETHDALLRAYRRITSA